MPNRILRDWTDSEKVNTLTANAEVLFTRLMMKADDYGCFHANPKLIRAALFPLKDVRESDISRWMDECQKSALIAFYESDGKKYLLIENFGQRLRAMNRKFPAPPLDSNLRTDDSSPPLEVEEEMKKKQETETKQKTAAADAHTLGYENLIKNKSSIAEFIKAKKPLFIKPYADLWNLFADENKKPKIKELTDSRRRKFQTRIQEEHFDFLLILKTAKNSEFMMLQSFFGFDWIIESKENYLKILEGKYDNNKSNFNQQSVQQLPTKKPVDFFEKMVTDIAERAMCLPEYFNFIFEKDDSLSAQEKEKKLTAWRNSFSSHAEMVEAVKSKIGIKKTA